MVSIFVPALFSAPAGAAARQEPSIRVRHEGRGLVFSGRIPSAEPGQEVVLQRLARGAYTTFSTATVRGSRRTFRGLSIKRLPARGKHRYRLMSAAGGDTDALYYIFIWCHFIDHGGHVCDVVFSVKDSTSISFSRRRSRAVPAPAATRVAAG